MCKKMLQSLMGGGAKPPAPPAEAQTPYAGGKEGDVLGTVAQTAGGGTVDVGAPKLSGGLDPKKRGKGVPGLGL